MTPTTRQNITSITILIIGLTLLGHVFLILDLDRRVDRIERFIRAPAPCTGMGMKSPYRRSAP